MAAAEPQPFSQLNDSQQINSWLRRFDRSWQKGRLATWVGRLPPPGSPLRLSALVGLVRIDLKRHWQQGQRVGIETYLQAHPELGTAEVVPAELIAAEYEARRQYCSPAEVLAFLKRYPQQAQQLRLLAGPTRENSLPVLLASPNLQATLLPDGSTPSDAAPAFFGGSLPEQFGRYRILKKLGQGGMGTVYLAQDTQLDRQVALKVPHFQPEEGSDVLERFYREGRAAAALDHPNLCPIYDIGEQNGIHYLTMPYLEGKPLSEATAEGRLLSQRQAAGLVHKLAAALEEAHHHGLIHRDLKPSNIMLSKRGEPIIMDFGLARRTNRDDIRLTRRGEMLGTPAYMPPEQVAGDVQAIGPACDIYSLGVILYQLLTGQLPFRGSLEAVLMQVLTEEPPPPSAHRPDLDAALDAICQQAMAKEIAGRYATMGEMAKALTDYLESCPRASRSRPAPRPRRAFRLAGAAVVVMVLTATGLFVADRFWGSQESERTVEEAKTTGQDDLPALPVPTAASIPEQVASANNASDPKKPEGDLHQNAPAPQPDSHAANQPASERPKDVESAPREPVALKKESVPQTHPAEEPKPKVESKAPSTEEPRARTASNAAAVIPGDLVEPKPQPQLAVVTTRDPVKPEPKLPELPAGAIRRFENPRAAVWSVALSPDGRRALSGGGGPYALKEGKGSSPGGQALYLWDVETGQPLRSFGGHTGPITSVAFSSDGHRALSGSFDSTLRLWDVDTGQEIHSFGSPGMQVTSLALSPSGHRLLTGSQGLSRSGSPDYRVRVWDVLSGSELGEFRGHTTAVWCVAFSPDGRRALSGSGGYETKIGQPLYHNGQRVVRDCTVRLWDVASGKELRCFQEHTAPVRCVAFAPDGRRAVSGGADGTVHVWDLESGRPLHCLEGHTRTVSCVAFTPDGRRLLSGSWDKTVRLWDADRGRVLRRFEGHSGEVRSLALSRDGRRALTGGDDRTLRLWQLPR